MHFILVTGVYIADDAPWVIHFRLTEPISVIPCPDCSLVLLQSVMFQHLIYFVLCKSEMFRIAGIHDRDDIQVI